MGVGITQTVNIRRTNGVSIAAAVVVAAATVLLLVGCSTTPEPENSGTPSQAEANDNQQASGDNVAETPTQPVPEDPEDETGADSEDPSERVQAETCGWDSPALPSSAQAAVPSGESGELNDVIVGAWQHVSYDAGEGYIALDDKDIRFVFPSAERMLYCQHVPGATDHAENAADISWDGNTIVHPNGTALYTVEAWDGDVMIWINLRDQSRYLLQRR